MQYAWLGLSLTLLIVWGAVYLTLKERKSKKKMLAVSFVTALLGFTEPLFVPEYWSPPSLFNLALRTGFDIESIVFAFAVGGIVAVAYEVIVGGKSMSMTEDEINDPRHSLHMYTLAVAPVLFVFLLVITNLNPIYSAIIALITGFFAAWYCRPDLLQRMLLGGLLFTIVYFLAFSALLLVYPNYVEEVWNLDALSNVVLAGIPIEEYLWAFTFGLIWSSIYEHFKWRKMTV